MQRVKETYVAAHGNIRQVLYLLPNDINACSYFRTIVGNEQEHREMCCWKFVQPGVDPEALQLHNNDAAELLGVCIVHVLQISNKPTRGMVGPTYLDFRHLHLMRVSV